RPRPTGHAGAVAGRTRCRDQAPATTAFGARLRHGEEALVDRHLSRASTRGAGHRLRTRCRAAAVTRGAGSGPGELHRDRDAGHRVVEREGDLGLEVSPSLPARTALACAPAEHASQELL